MGACWISLDNAFEEGKFLVVLVPHETGLFMRTSLMALHIRRRLLESEAKTGRCNQETHFIKAKLDIH